jgi:glycerol kinase
VAYQTLDLVEAMRADFGGANGTGAVIRADGGMSVSDWTMQNVADMIEAPVDRPVVLETTALGAGYLAGLQSGLFPEPEEFAKTWHLEKRFTPTMDAPTREAKLAGWRDAVARTVLKPSAL